ncbi:hypothetical protein RFI_09098, partial [Reticulomyxa filosa]
FLKKKNQKKKKKKKKIYNNSLKEEEKGGLPLRLSDKPQQKKKKEMTYQWNGTREKERRIGNERKEEGRERECRLDWWCNGVERSVSIADTVETEKKEMTGNERWQIDVRSVVGDMMVVSFGALVSCICNILDEMKWRLSICSSYGRRRQQQQRGGGEGEGEGEGGGRGRHYRWGNTLKRKDSFQMEF